MMYGGGFFTDITNMKSLTFLVILTLSEGSELNSTMYMTSTDQLITYVHKIIVGNIEQEQNLLVSYSDNYIPVNLLLGDIHQHYGTVQVSNPYSPEVGMSSRYEKIGTYIILLNNKGDLNGQLEGLADRKSWNNKAHFLAVVTIPVESPRLLSLEIVKYFWYNANALDVVILISDNRVFNLYTWYPHNSETECWTIQDVVLLNQWNVESTGELRNCQNIFTDKIPRKFNGCPMNVSINFKEDSELQFLRNSLDVFGFTVRYQANHVDNANIYDRANKVVNDVIFGYSEIGYGVPLQEEVVGFLDSSFPFSDFRYMWYVPCAKPYDRIQRISGIFSTSVWVIILTFMLLSCIVIRYLATRSSAEGKAYLNITSVIYNMWAITMNTSVTEMPQTYKLRAVILAWVCYCFAVSTIFLTFFTSFLVDPGLDKQITNIKELLDSRIEYGFGESIDFYFANSEVGLHKQLLKYRKLCNQTELCIKRIMNTGKFATFAEPNGVRNVLKSRKKGKKLCRMNDSDTYNVLVVAYFSKGSYLVETFDKYMSSISESGLVTREDTTSSALSTKDTADSEDVPIAYFPLSTNHLLVAFYSLLLGYFLSFIVLIGEILNDKTDWTCRALPLSARIWEILSSIVTQTTGHSD
jgi:hypothetical protein